VNYQCAGTVEFLMDMETGAFYFIEVNPRVQVEHTVTEEVTGIDIVRAQILITEGKSLTEATGTPAQYDVKLDGHAIQCRITTEDPANNFIPDYGRITAYRGATGMGIRLDGGTAYSGAVITRYYDSLLEKVTAWAPTPEAAIARMDRALREFRIRGVSTNIAFVENLLKHPTFLNYQYHTKFIDETPELFDFKPRRDRATRILTYIADITVNGHPETAAARTPRRHQGPEAPRAPGRGARDGDPPASGRTRARGGGEMDEGADAPSDHRHHHARRAPVASGHPHALARHDQGRARLCREPAGALSVECWGGATFDVAYRFLQECPWQRLRDIRAAMPNIMTQMLLRGANGVGYTTYPDNVVQKFVHTAAESGVDVFRVFDSLNWVENMRVSMDAVLETGKICEGTICYTGNILDPDRAKYDLKYYVAMAKELEAAGAHVLGLKDMAGLLKPAAAAVLIPALKDAVDLPIHFHTHDTAGVASGTILEASKAGVDAVDCAMDALSGNTSPGDAGHGRRGAALHRPGYRSRHRRDPRDLGLLGGRARPLRGLRERHAGPGLRGLSPRDAGRPVHQPQGAGALHGAGGSLARGGADVCRREPDVRRYREGHAVLQGRGRHGADDGQPGSDPRRCGGPEEGGLLPRQRRRHDARQSRPAARRLPSRHPEEGAEGRAADPRTPRQERATRRPRGAARRGGRPLDVEVDDEDLMGYMMYPKVFTDYATRHKDYGPVRTLPTRTFFYGMEPGEEIEAEIDPGVTLVIRLSAVGETNEEGEVRVFFELNGQPRTIRVPNRKIAASQVKRPKAEAGNPNHIGAPMPGVVATVAVSAGRRSSRATSC
jgi:pyruvate carboxylase